MIDEANAILETTRLPLSDMAGALVPEASGKTMKFYLEPTRLLRFDPFINQLLLLELDFS